MDSFVDFLTARNMWSRSTFGEGRRTEGICKHIESELQEIRKAPTDIYEWVDIILLALDGAYRAGYTPMAVLTAIYKKHHINVQRDWGEPTPEDQPTFHKEN